MGSDEDEGDKMSGSDHDPLRQLGQAWSASLQQGKAMPCFFNSSCSAAVAEAVAAFARQHALALNTLTAQSLHLWQPYALFAPLLCLPSAEDQLNALLEQACSYKVAANQLRCALLQQRPDRKELLLYEERAFERRALLEGWSNLFALTQQQPQLIHLRAAQQIGPASMALLRQLLSCRLAHGCVFVIEIDADHCLSGGPFETQWEQFFEWLEEHHVLHRTDDEDGAGQEELDQAPPLPGPQQAAELMDRSLHLFAFDEVVYCAKTWLEQSAQDQAYECYERQIRVALGRAHFYLGQFDEARELLSALNDELELCADNASQIPICGMLAQLYLFKQDLETALLYAGRALQYSKLLGREHQYARSLFIYYYIHDQSTTPIPLDQFQQMIELLDRQHQQVALIYCLRNYYIMLRFHDDVTVEGALAANANAIRLARALGHRAALASAWQNRGTIYSYRQQDRRTLRCMTISARLRDQLGDCLDRVRVYNGLGYFYTQCEQFDKALELFNRAFEVLRRERNFSELTVTLFNYAWLYFLVRDYAHALRIFDAVLRICKARNLSHFPFRNLHDVYALKGYCHVKLGEILKAQQCAERIAMLSFEPSVFGSFLSSLFQAQLAAATGDSEGAKRQFEQAPAILDRLLDRQINIDIRMLPFCAIEHAQLLGHLGQFEQGCAVLRRGIALALELGMERSGLEQTRLLVRFQQQQKRAEGLRPFALKRVNLPLGTLISLAQQETLLDDALRRLRETSLFSRIQSLVENHSEPVALASETLRLICSAFSAHEGRLLCMAEGHWQLLASYGAHGKLGDCLNFLKRLQAGEQSIVVNHQVKRGAFGTFSSFSTTAVMPMLRNGQLIGALIMANPESSRALSSHDRDILAGLTHQLSNQMEQLQHRIRLEQMSSTDQLTGLLNRQTMQLRLRARMSEVERQTGTCSVAFIDLDYFKHINDQFGHEAGDRVLQAFAELVRDCLRAYDIAARWGGDEFVILFPNTCSAIAARVAERILQRFRDQAWQLPPLSQLIDTTPALSGQGLCCSIGIAEYAPAQVGIWDEAALIRRADEALYQAKAKGKGCVAVWPAPDQNQVAL